MPCQDCLHQQQVLTVKAGCSMAVDVSGSCWLCMFCNLVICMRPLMCPCLLRMGDGLTGLSSSTDWQCAVCRTVATNVFEKQDGRWVMVHHHGGPAPIFV